MPAVDEPSKEVHDTEELAPLFLCLLGSWLGLTEHCSWQGGMAGGVELTPLFITRGRVCTISGTFPPLLKLV